MYFRVGAFESYGRLSGQHVHDLVAGARIEPGEAKESPPDFALWKGTKPDEDVSWPSPWGPGRPGWHIECSAMAREHLGDGFDVHGGGLDLVFPHHENERAQSEGAGANPFARRWLHNGMLRLGDEKMSKSVGNVERLRDALDRVGRETLLAFFAGASYRMPIDYHARTLEQAAAVADRFRETLRNARRYARAGAAGGDGGIATVGRDAAVAFDVAMADDLDTPAALAVLHGLASELNAAVGGGDADPAAVAEAADSLRDALWVLGLHTLDPGSDAADVPQAVVALAEQREAARAARDFARSDELRDEISRSWVPRARHARRASSWCRTMPRPEREPRRRNEEPRDNMVYGVQPVREALRGRRRVHKVYCTERAAEHTGSSRPLRGGRRSRSAPWMQSRPSRAVRIIRDSPR